MPGEILPECSVINSQRINDQCMGQVVGTWVVILNKFWICNIIQAHICSIMLYHNLSLSLSLHRHLNRWDWPRVLGSGASSATLQMRQPKAVPQLPSCELCPPVRATCGAGDEGPEGPGLAAMSFKADRREKTCKHSRGCHRSLSPLSSGNLKYRLLIKPGWKIPYEWTFQWESRYIHGGFSLPMFDYRKATMQHCPLMNDLPRQK